MTCCCSMFISTATHQSPSLKPCGSTFGCIVCPCSSTAPVRLHIVILISIERGFAVAISIMCPFEVGGSRTAISKSWIFNFNKGGSGGGVMGLCVQTGTIVGLDDEEFPLSSSMMLLPDDHSKSTSALYRVGN
jgi:hypothetical protein